MLNRDHNCPFRVLVIEDESRYSAMIASSLEASSYAWKIKVVATTAEAYTVLQHRMVDVILFDLDIVELSASAERSDVPLFHLKQLRKICTPTTTIVVLTERDDRTSVDLIHHGAQDCLMKHELSPSTLLHTMQNAAARQQLQQDLDSTQQQIVRTTALMNRCIDNALVGIWDYDLQNKNMYLSPHWKQMLGYTDADVSNHEEWWLTLVHPDDLAHVQAAIRQHMEKRSRHFRTEHRLHHHDGHWIWVYSSGAVTWSDEGTALYRSGTTVDISARKRLEGALQEALLQLQQDHKLKERFLSNISHDIRTPMNAILGFSEMMLRAVEDDDMDKYQLREQLQLIHSNGELLNGLLSDLMELSRLRSNDMVAVKKDFHLWSLLETSIGVFLPQAKEKGLDFSFSLDPAVPMRIKSDSERLRRIIYHLLSNAVKYTDHGHIAVDASLAQGVFVLRVENTGATLSPEQKDALLPFIEEDEDTPTNSTSGIGLSVCSGLTRLIGGELCLEDRLGGGCVFSFRLPVHEGAMTASIRAESRVLCVSHDPLCRESIRHAVVTWGGQCLVASTPPESIHNVDLAIIDLREQHASVAWSMMAQGVSQAIVYDVFNHEQAAENRNLSKQVTALTWPIRLSDLYRLLEVSLRPRAVGEPSTDATEQAPPLNVLVVEDTEVNRKVAHLMLRKLGVKHTFAVNGAEALDLYRTHHHDFVLLDLNLPDISGKEVATSIRAIEAATWGRTFICALTADARPELQDVIPELDEFLTKPLSTARLGAVLDSRNSTQGSIESETLRSTLAVLEDEAESFVCEVFQQLHSAIEIIQALSVNGDYAAIYDISHRLKSAAAYVGAMPLSHLCEALCRYTKYEESVSDDVQRCVDQLCVESAHVMEALHREVAHVFNPQ